MKIISKIAAKELVSEGAIIRYEYCHDRYLLTHGGFTLGIVRRDTFERLYNGEGFLARAFSDHEFTYYTKNYARP